MTATTPEKPEPQETAPSAEDVATKPATSAPPPLTSGTTVASLSNRHFNISFARQANAESAKTIGRYSFSNDRKREVSAPALGRMQSLKIPAQR